jgi:cobalamin biosynthesis protein CobT
MSVSEYLLKLGMSLSGTSADLIVVGNDGDDGNGDDGNGDDGNGDEGDEGETHAHAKNGNSAGNGGTADDGDEFDAAEFAALLAAANSAGLKDTSSALEGAIRDEGDDGTVNGPEEAVWRPFSTEQDEVRWVTLAREKDAGQKLMASVRREVAFLRARLRNKFLESKQPRVFHGVRNGQALSERRLADTWAEIQSGIAPTRPDTRTVHRDQVSIAVAVVIDQSGSMDHRLKDSARAMAAIAVPLDEVGCPVLCLGFRTGSHTTVDDWNDRNQAYEGAYHRTQSVNIDIFKGWDDPCRTAIHRFPKVKATGCTPMSDGIQFALQALSERKERHRIIMVITDGDPDSGHERVIRRQQRIAREAGIAIVGVGIDYGCRSVEQLYERPVVVDDISQLPERLLATINDIVFPRGPARKAALDGKMKMKVHRGAA